MKVAGQWDGNAKRYAITAPAVVISFAGVSISSQ